MVTISSCTSRARRSRKSPISWPTVASHFPRAQAAGKRPCCGVRTHIHSPILPTKPTPSFTPIASRLIYRERSTAKVRQSFPRAANYGITRKPRWIICWFVVAGSMVISRDLEKPQLRSPMRTLARRRGSLLSARRRCGYNGVRGSRNGQPSPAAMLR